MARQCGAQTRSRGLCHRPAKAGSARCWLHGATAGRPRGTPEHPNSRAARLEGRLRWVERMREAKARGEIERFPGGRRARGLPRLSKNPIIRKAQRIVEKAKAMVDQAIATVPERPWSELSHPEKLALETGVSLDIIAKILNDGAQILERDGLEGTDIKLATFVRDTAQSVISNQIRIDSAKLAAGVSSPAGLTEAQRRERARAAILEAFAERPQPDNGVADSDSG